MVKGTAFSTQIQFLFLYCETEIDMCLDECKLNEDGKRICGCQKNWTVTFPETQVAYENYRQKTTSVVDYIREIVRPIELANLCISFGFTHIMDI